MGLLKNFQTVVKRGNDTKEDTLNEKGNLLNGKPLSCSAGAVLSESIAGLSAMIIISVKSG